MTARVGLFISTMCLFAYSGAFADQVPKGHGHKTPHGGIVQEAGEIHVELLIDKSGQPKVYLYDKAMKPMRRKDLQGRLTVKGHDGPQHTRDLKPSGSSKEGVVLVGKPIKGLTDWDRAVVSLKIKGRWTHIRFSHH